MFRLLLEHTTEKGLQKEQRRRNRAPNADYTELDRLHSVAEAALLNPGAEVVICDEGHRIKNSATALTVLLKQVATRRRVVLTGFVLRSDKCNCSYCLIITVQISTAKQPWRVLVHGGLCAPGISWSVRPALGFHVLTCHRLRQRFQQHV